MRSSYKSKDGKLYFGASTGYYFFDPRLLKSRSKSPQVILSEFRVADKLVKPGNNSPLAAPLFTVSEIRLPYYQNVFSIGFSLLITPTRRTTAICLCWRIMMTRGARPVQTAGPVFIMCLPVNIFKVKANSDGPMG